MKISIDLPKDRDINELTEAEMRLLLAVGKPLQEMAPDDGRYILYKGRPVRVFREIE